MNDILVVPPRMAPVDQQLRNESMKQMAEEMGFGWPDRALPPIKDSGKREEMPTGSRRDTREGKGRFDLLPARALTRVAKLFEAGAVKYGDRNWEKGQPLSRMMDSALRHAFKYLQGERDEDHLIAACWNLLCCADIEERIKEGSLPECLDDLPNPSAPLGDGPAV